MITSWMIALAMATPAVVYAFTAKKGSPVWRTVCGIFGVFGLLGGLAVATADPLFWLCVAAIAATAILIPAIRISSARRKKRNQAEQAQAGGTHIYLYPHR